MLEQVMKNQNFGVEIEVTGASRSTLVAAVCEAVQGHVTAISVGGLSATEMIDPQGRTWRICTDSSIPNMNGHMGLELVSPILKYEDIELIQTVARKMRIAGARVPEGTSVHIHVDGAGHSSDSVARLAKTMYKNEDLLYKAFQVYQSRLTYAGKMSYRFVTDLAKKSRVSKDDLNVAWFGDDTYINREPRHYEGHRYHGLNLNNLWRPINTIEFRYFQFTKGIHAGQLKSWIQFVLAVSAKAIVSNRAKHDKVNTDNDKFAMRVWLKSLGLVGDEFKTARHHLVSHLTGCSDYRHSRAATPRVSRSI